MINKKMIDPPSGWLYGFPKVIPQEEGLDINTWLVANGYPQAEIDKFKADEFPCRMWMEPWGGQE